jgi:hypothetical protein
VCLDCLAVVVHPKPKWRHAARPNNHSTRRPANDGSSSGLQIQDVRSGDDRKPWRRSEPVKFAVPGPSRSMAESFEQAAGASRHQRRLLAPRGDDEALRDHHCRPAVYRYA